MKRYEMSRWVQRNGLQVEFGNLVGGFVGSTYYYEFPTEQLAEAFELVVKTPASDGNVSAIEPDIWGKYRVKK